MTDPMREPSPASRRRSGRARQQITWSVADAAQLKHFIEAFTSDGAAVLFGRTLDGGSLSAQVLHGKDKVKDYATTPGDIAGMLDDLLDDFGLTVYLTGPADHDIA
jgi:hypothetical protein